MGSGSLARRPERVPLDELRLVLAVVASEGVVCICGPRSVLVVERGEVVGRVSDRVEVHRQDGCGQGELGEEREVVGRRTLVGIATLGDVQRVGRRVQLHAVGGVVLFGARQATHQVELLPGRPVLRESRDHAGIGVQVQVRSRGAGSDPRIAGGDVDDRTRWRARDQDSGEEPSSDRGINRPVVVVIGDRLDEADRLGVRHRVVVLAVPHDRVGLDHAIELANVQSAVGSPL